MSKMSRVPKLRHLAFTCVLLPWVVVASCAPKAEAPAETAAEEITEVPQYPIEAFLDVTGYGGGSFSPDGSKLLVSHDKTGIYNAYALATDGSGETA